MLVKLGMVIHKSYNKPATHSFKSHVNVCSNGIDTFSRLFKVRETTRYVMAHERTPFMFSWLA